MSAIARKQRPRISVVTPSFNQGQFLEQCIRSVLDQNYPDLEYLILDGGSTDDSVEVIRKYADRLTYWVSEPDGGQSAAINKGFRRATGEIVAWMNADDFYLPGAFDRVAAAYQKTPDASFYFGDGWRANLNGKKISGYFPDGRVLFDRQALLYGLNYILQPATFINRRHLEQIEYLNPDLKYGMDSDLWMRLASAADPLAIQAVLAASREYGDTKTSTGSFARVEELRQISEKHTGVPMTPGAICYFLDTLHRLTIQREDLFSSDYRNALQTFWTKTSHLLAQFGTNSSGFPQAGRQSVDSRRSDSRWSEGPVEPVQLDPPGQIDGKKRRLKIGIVLRQVTLGNTGGIALLLKGVLESLFRRHPEHEYHVYCTVFNRGLLENCPNNVRFHSLPIGTYIDNLNEQLGEIDVLLRDYPQLAPIRFPLEKQIFVIPDIQHEYYPDFFQADVLRSRREAFTQALSSAGGIATISEFARQTLIDQPCTGCDDIFIMSPALQEDHRTASLGKLTTEERALVPEGEFFLFPANLWPHKNHRRVLQAFKRFLQNTGRPVKFVFTGHPDGWEKLRDEFSDLPIDHLGFVSAPLLRLLLQRTRALVYFSLYEGFGMPLLEAFDVGAPVICSNTTSLPEVGGDAVLYADPTDVDAMAALMAQVTEPGGLRNDMIVRGKQRLKQYTWEQSADNLSAALERTADPTQKFGADSRITVKAPPPVVSIVTPSYNQGRFLRRTIESVLNQTYPHIDYCVMDGGSKDESVEILKSYGDRFPWISEPDDGQTAAINKGFARSRGDIRAYLNSDDTLLPDAVEKAVDYLQRHSGCDLVYGRAQYIDERDVVTGHYNTSYYSFTRLMEDCCICQPAAFWRADIAKRIGPFDESLDFVMDYDYWMRIDRAGGRLDYLPELLANSRLYPETKTLSSRAKIYQEIFHISRRHAGYVDLNFFHGYWHHLCHERTYGIGRILRRYETSLAYLHHKWVNRRYYSNKRVAKRVVRGILGQTKRQVLSMVGTSLVHAANGLNGLSQCAGAAPPGNTNVAGLWADNWIGPDCRVDLRHANLKRSLHLAGIAPRDMILTIHSYGQIVGMHEIPANKYVRIDVPTNQVRGTDLQLKFSKHYLDKMQRQLSFHLQDTNLFTEQDFA